jgi:hypothetical protein
MEQKDTPELLTWQGRIYAVTYQQALIRLIDFMHSRGHEVVRPNMRRGPVQPFLDTTWWGYTSVIREIGGGEGE